MISYRSLAALGAAVLLASCGDKNPIQNITAPTAGSAVKFFNFAVGAPAVNFYADNSKISATTSTSCSDAVTGATTDPTCLAAGKEATTGTGYGANASTAGLYYSVAPGSHTLSGRITATTDNGLAIASTPATLENGKFYSYYLSGIYNSTAKSADAFFVADPMPDLDFTKPYVRFVNAISNSQPMTLYARLQNGAETAIGADVAYKGAGAFVGLAPGIYDLSTRVAGSSTNVIATTGVSFSAGRVYTVSARGDITVTSTTATTRPILDVTTNR
jgi:uncharacterized protein DUF4397